MLTSDERMKQILEENRGLKSYIHNINSECLELNAVLFEEANKMVNAARVKQHVAERKAKETAQENELLKTQVEDLRALVASLPNPLSPTITNSSESPFDSTKNFTKKLSKWGTIGPKKTPTLPPTPKFFRKSCENLGLLLEPSPGEMLTVVGRSTLLNALLAEENDSGQLDHVFFQDFLEWIKMGCPLELPTAAQSTQAESDHLQSIKERVVIIRMNNESENHPTPDVPGSPVCRNPDSQPEASQHNVNSTGSAMESCSRFMQRLYDEDIRPCLNFKDHRLLKAIYNALPQLALEIDPMSASNGSPTENCPLLPPLEVSYRLKIKALSTGKDSSEEYITANISAEARNRIASVVNLFQYLSMINRGLINTSSVDRNISPGGSPRSSSSFSSSSLSPQSDTQVLNKQFARIQRVRLLIAFAKLGFGLPDLE